MKLHYRAKFNGDIDSLPHGEHKPGAVKFKEPENPKKLGIITNGIALGMYFIMLPIFVTINGGISLSSWLIGCGISLLLAFPHELLHAVCFQEDVYLYTNYKNGMLFVTGPEDMSKVRFAFMLLFPNLVFGIIPFILFLINPNLELLGCVGAFSVPMGAGDYFNCFNALRQIPKGARTYLYGFNSWWYKPLEEKPNR